MLALIAGTGLYLHMHLGDHGDARIVKPRL